MVLSSAEIRNKNEFHDLKVMDFKWKEAEELFFKLFCFLFLNILLVNKDTVVINFLTELLAEPVFPRRILYICHGSQEVHLVARPSYLPSSSLLSAV